MDYYEQHGRNAALTCRGGLDETGCAYRDCLHRGEPECAVRARAHLDPFLQARLASYRGMLAELG